MSGQRDIRERGVDRNTHSAMSDALERRRREDEEAAQRRRAHQRLYEAQFRRPSKPIDAKASLRATKRWLDRAFGRLREKPKTQACGPSLHDDLTPEQVFRGPPVRNVPVQTAVMPPRNHAEIAPWILDAETLEFAFAIDDMTLPTWSTDPYSNLWSSVGLILDDEEFQHVRIYLGDFHISYPYSFFQSCL